MRSSCAVVWQDAPTNVIHVGIPAVLQTGQIFYRLAANRPEPRMDTLQAILIAILQGATELFPVSSLGHAVVLPALLHSNIDQRSHEFLPFLVMLHLGTATALLAYFWRDWWALGSGVIGFGGAREGR